MNRKRQNQIEQLAVSLLRETGYYGFLPINVEGVASKKGIQIIKHDFGEEISGVLISQGEHHTIGVNKNNHLNRRRFTIAHELGHFVLGHQRIGPFVDTPDKYFTIFNFRNDKSSTGEFLQEREANAFAAALLMPTDLIIEAFQTLSQTLNILDEKVDVVKELARMFGVSNQAMGLRLSNIGSLW